MKVQHFVLYLYIKAVFTMNFFLRKFHKNTLLFKCIVKKLHFFFSYFRSVCVLRFVHYYAISIAKDYLFSQTS
jgi:hypothetical protein